MDGSKILITGGTGSWSNELVRQLLNKYSLELIRIFSRGEHKQVEMQQKFKDRPELDFFIGDVRDKERLSHAMKDIDIVIHLAALKHVPICEKNAWEAVLTNIYGTQNIIEAAIENNVRTVVDVSTDKAVDPLNVYGITKACGEKLVINARNNYKTDTKFVCIRGGNVMGTNGSVLPLFINQIRKDNRITITDKEMTRFLMSTKDAISLIFKAIDAAVGDEIFVMRMPALNIMEIADIMIKKFGNKDTAIDFIGIRPGEKLDEILVSRNESPRTKVFSDDYYLILPYEDKDKYNKYKNLPSVDFEEFTSRNAHTLDENTFIEKLESEEWLNIKTSL
ncbi:polysaccharide biosynthesis protein [Gammaproteobacteria bacterium]|nr:polysaccharide biosynthesis protein [Gammaproteobacteria bacterium]